MEETAIPLYSWFWLVVPMSVVFLLSILNYLRHRTSAKPADNNKTRNKSADHNARRSHQPGQDIASKDVPEEKISGEKGSGKPRASGKDLSFG